jgi:hypothetical protein
MQVTLHFDPTCPWTWMTSRWLVRAAELEDLEVGWAPFSLAHLGDDTHAREATRVVQHLLAIDDPKGIATFYEAYGDLAHRQGREQTPALVEEAARAAGLDDAAVASAADESLDDAIDIATDLAYASAGPDVGSPILHWTDDQAQDVWIFGPLVDHVPDAPCAAELWRGVRHLAVHDMFKELKRGRKHPPDVASS